MRQLSIVCILIMSMVVAGCWKSSGVEESDTETDIGSDTNAGGDTDTGTGATDFSETAETDGVDTNTDSETANTDTGVDTSTDTGVDTDTDTDTDTGMATGMVWVSIPGGTFDMGSIFSSIEQPIHAVTVPSFEMLQTEVTAAQYKECVTADGCTVPGTTGTGNATYGYTGRENNPVNYVNWEEAVDFCTWIGGRLPTEAEWEYAARSGGQDITYPWGDETATCSYAVMSEGGHGCGTGSTMEVCSMTAGNTTQGLCDMAGNVWEWVQDWYHSNYLGAPADGSAWDDSTYSRVIRGGSFGNSAVYLRAALRGSFTPPSGRSYYLGFRCAKDLI